LKNPAIDPATRATVDSIIALSEPLLPKTYTSGHFRFFYTDNDPDPRNNATLTQIKKTALALNASWTSYSSNFTTPKHYLAGTKQMLDIKVYWLGDTLKGQTNTLWNHILLNSQLTVADDCMLRTTSAHELFHRVQFIYASDNLTPNMLWLFEGTAQWAKKYRYESIRDYMGWMNKGLTSTDPSIGFMQRANDTVHFWVYLEKRWGWAAIKEVWETFKTNGHDAKAAVDKMLQDKNRNSSFDQFVGEWALTNYVKDTANPGMNDYDEDEISKTSCGVTYGPLVSVPALPNNLIITKNTQPWVKTTFVRPYNADYYQFGIDPGVTGIDLKLDGKDTGSFRYYVLGMKNNSVITQSTAGQTDYVWEQTFPAGRYDKIAVVVVGMDIGGSYKINVEPTSSPTCNGIRATIVGTDGNDDIQGTFGSDVIAGLDGDDKISGGLGGEDLICGGAGNDDIFLMSYGQAYGNDGNDTLRNAGAGYSILSGGEGNDIIDLSGGFADILLGGDGDDVLSSHATTGPGNSLYGGFGNDVLEVNGPVNHTLTGGDGDDSLSGGDGNDRLYGKDGDDILKGGRGADFFSGGDGDDTNVDFNKEEGDKSDGT